MMIIIHYYCDYHYNLLSIIIVMSLIRINMIIIDRNATYYDYDYDYTYYDRHIFEFESEYIETRPSE